MKILHIYKGYPPVVGGIENHLRLLAEAQARRGLDVTVLVTSRDGPTSVRDERGVRVIRTRAWARFRSTPLSPGMVGWVRRLRPDVTHLQFPYPPGELAHRLFGCSKATVVTYQSDIVRQRWLATLYAPGIRRLLRDCDRILVTSPAYLQSSPYLREAAARCSVVPLGIDPNPFQNVDPAGAERIRQREGSPLVLFVGRLRYYKGLDLLIDAAAAIDGRILVVGHGPMGRPWKRRAAASPAAARIRFAGEVSDTDLPLYYAAADVVVLPSSRRSEAFGQVLLEAMAAARPVVSTELGTGTSFVNQHGKTGLVVANGDTKGLADAVNSLLRQPERGRTMGANGQRRVHEEFHVERMVERTLKVYRQALATGDRRSGPEEVTTRGAS